MKEKKQKTKLASKFKNDIKSLLKILSKLFLDVLRFILKFLKILIIVLIIVTIISIIYSKSLSTWFELRTANVVEYILDNEDGVSTFDLGKTALIAAKRSLVARCTYDDTMTEDCYRHFSWCYEGTRTIGKDEMKAIADNHEVAFKIRKDVFTYTKHQFKNVYLQGDLKHKIFALYYTARDMRNYSLEKREEYYYNITSGMVDIKDYVDGYTVMDFYNNYQGRKYYDDELGINDAFLIAYKNGDVCLSHEVTDDEYEFTRSYINNEFDE